MIRVGRVQSSTDRSAGGILKIQALDDSQEIVDALPCSPNLGDGYGFLSVPGPGSLVLFVQIPEQPVPGIQQLFRHAWLGVIGSVITQVPGLAAFSKDKNDPDETNNSQKQNLGLPGYPEKLQGLTGPEPENSYADNFIPQQDIFKSQAGHKLVLSKKITAQGTHDNSILLETASGKGLRIDDGPPELKMDKISLRDETNHGARGERGPNRFEIITHEDKAELVTERDQVHVSFTGGQDHVIMQGSQSQRRTNRGEGDIVDTTVYGNHIISSQKDISRTSQKGDITDQAVEGSIQCTASEGAITLTAPIIKLVANDSKITLDSEGITIESGNKITLNGQTIINGAATVSGGLGVDNVDFGSHVHGGVDTGSDFTNPPI